MKKYVTDTMALIKFMNGQQVINETIDSIFHEADNGSNIIVIPAVTVFEIGYLFEKRRIPISVHDVKNILDSTNYIEEKLSVDIIETSFEISDIPELHDRLIAGTARHNNLELLTNDSTILKSSFVKCVK